jgi:hypothetical protein
MSFLSGSLILGGMGYDKEIFSGLKKPRKGEIPGG